MIINYHCKANKKVWAFQNFRTNDRYQCKDGNYILWQTDMVNIGSKLGMTIGSDFRQFLMEVCEQIGAVLLTLPEAKEEQDGKVTRTLPEALDVRFQLDKTNTNEIAGGVSDIEPSVSENIESEKADPENGDNTGTTNGEEETV